MTSMPAAPRYIGIDFEYGSNTKGAICAYGLAFEDGTQEHGFVQLPAAAPIQEHTRFHRITQKQTDGGMEFIQLYARIAELAAEEPTIFVAHDLRSDRRAWRAAQLIHGLPALPLSWVDSLPMARTELKISKHGGGAGIAAVAKHYGMEINHHNPEDDALVALQIVLRNPRSKNIVRDTDAAQRVKSAQR